jgi:hypothetical protein
VEHPNSGLDDLKKLKDRVYRIGTFPSQGPREFGRSLDIRKVAIGPFAEIPLYF